MKKNVIFIPARVGSTRVKNKNIQKIGNETLLSRKIKICLKAKIGDVIGFIPFSSHSFQKLLVESAANSHNPLPS